MNKNTVNNSSREIISSPVEDMSFILCHPKRGRWVVSTAGAEKDGGGEGGGDEGDRD